MSDEHDPKPKDGIKAANVIPVNLRKDNAGPVAIRTDGQFLYRSDNGKDKVITADEIVENWHLAQTPEPDMYVSHVDEKGQPVLGMPLTEEGLDESRKFLTSFIEDEDQIVFAKGSRHDGKAAPEPSTPTPKR